MITETSNEVLYFLLKILKLLKIHITEVYVDCTVDTVLFSKEWRL